MGKYRRVRAFLTAFLLTLAVWLFAEGFLLADIATRRVAFGEAAYPEAVALGDALCDITRWGEALPAPCRPLFWVFSGLRELFLQMMG